MEIKGDFKELMARYVPANHLAPVLRVMAAGACLLVAMACISCFKAIYRTHYQQGIFAHICSTSNFGHICSHLLLLTFS